eukprot:TRINITY_DN15924_c0_g1_i5.p1 TRINITY_DN15924_c0_g1~~TRINITY_DN15924_c0_g1_i5.p1  ORF type:complete len:620 (+),score=127.69 TRINITY_DN15924_c0_g1_i5:43-1902(+)
MQRTIRETFVSDELVIQRSQNIHANGVGQVYTVPSVEAVWTHWNTTVLGELFGGNPMYPGGEDFPVGAARKYNWVVGALRWRGFRVTSDSCTVPTEMQKFYTQGCFAEYDQDKENWIDQAVYGNPDVMNFSYSHESSLQMGETVGRLATYGGGGYSVDLPPNRSCFEVLSQMERAGFVDDATRAVAVDLSVYNGPLNQFGSIRLLYELPPSGGILLSTKMLPSNVYPFDTAVKVCSAIMSFLLLAYCYWFLSGEMDEIRERGIRYLFTSLLQLWTALEWVNVATILAQVILRIKGIVLASQGFDLSTDGYLPFYRIGAIGELAETFEAISLFLVVMRTLQFTVVHPRIAYHTFVYSQAKWGFLAFFSLYFLALFPFAAMGKIMFADVLVSYKDLWRSVVRVSSRAPRVRVGVRSVVTLVTASVGHFSYSELSAVDPILGPIYFIFFVCLISFSMVSLVVAVLLFAFKRTKAHILTELGKQEVQGLSYMIQDYAMERWQQFRSKTRVDKKGICVEHGEIAYAALLRSDADGDFEIDTEELRAWLKAYPEMRALFGVKGPRGMFRRFKCKEDVGLRRKELTMLRREMLEEMEHVDFYRKEAASMQTLQKQYEQGVIKTPRT